MAKLIRKYYMEVIAAFLVAGFWGGMWAYHAYQTHQTNAFRAAHTYPYTPGIDD